MHNGGFMQPNDLDSIARQIRLRDLQAVYEAGAGHIGGEMSAIDILTALYFRVLRVWPDEPKRPDRDRFVLSKGHVALALYVTLAKRGFLPEDEIATFLKPHSRLNGHPNCNKVPGVETNTGPLGHGLPVAVGMAKAAKLTGADYHTYVMTGDGEMQEGSNWEAIIVCGAVRAGQPDADHRPQPIPAGRGAEGYQRPCPVPTQAGGLRLGRDRDRRHAMARDRAAALEHRGARPTLRRRAYQQGPGHFVHAGYRRLAPQGAERRAICDRTWLNFRRRCR